MAGSGAQALDGEAAVPALAAAHPSRQLFSRVLTESQFGTHVAEITFPEPVMLTAARFGAALGGAAHQRSELLLFAQDAGTPAASRFLQLCPGLEQPGSGARMVQLQPCVTTRVLLRGQYQTVPLSLHGYSLAAAAAGAPPQRPRRLALAAALRWLRERQETQQAEGAATVGPAAAAAGVQGCGLQPAAEAALRGLLAHWKAVGASEHLMALHPPQPAAFKAAAVLADVVCGQLAAGSFGREPLQAPPLVPPAPPGKPKPQAGKQQANEQQPAEQHVKQEAGEQAADQQQVEQPASEQQPAQAAGEQAPAVQQQVPELEGSAVLDAAADMALGWTTLLAQGAKGCTAAALRCASAGLAAAVLLCSCGEGAALLVARGGVVVLDDVVAWAQAPPSFVRHAVTACLLVAHGCTALGGAALLGWWKPPRGLQLKSQRMHALRGVAALAARTAQAGAQLAAGPAAGGGPPPMDASHESQEEEAAEEEAHEQYDDGGTAPMDDQAAAEEEEEAGENDEAAAADAVAAAAAEVEQELYGLQLTAERGGEGGDDDPGLLRPQWQRATKAQEVDLMFGSSSEDEGDAPGYKDAVPLEEEAAPPAAEEQQQQQPEQEPSAAEVQQAQQRSQLAAALEADAEFGADVLPDPGPSDAPLPEAAAAASPAAAAGEGGDDLYGDLGMEVTIPQTDGAADSSPRRRRGRRGSGSEARRSGRGGAAAADPGERWEMGADDGSPDSRRRVRSGSRRRESSGEREQRRKDSRRGKPKDRSRERGKKDKRRERSRERREAEERRARQQQAEEEERRRRRQQEAAEEEERRRRRQLEAAEEEERRRRRLHEAAEEEQQRRLRQRQEEEARWRRREEEEARRRQQDDEVQRRQRYQEQQRRLEAEQQRLEAEVAARARQQQQQPQAAPGDREDAERRRKRQRSPAAPSGGGPDRHWQGKQPRIEQGGRQQRDGAGAAAVSPRRQQLAGARGAAAVSPRWSRQQQRVHASHRPVPQDEAGLWQWHDRQRQGATGRYWQPKARAFAGVTAHVARRLLDSVQPPRLALLSRQLLHLLRAQEAAAAFQAAAARLVEGHRVGESGDPTSLPTPEASMLASEAVDSMKQLAELLAKPLPTAAGAAQHGTPAGEPPAALLDAVVSRRLLALLAALLHVPAVHRLALEAALPASAAAVGAAQAAAVEAALATQLGLGTKALLAVLASSRGGRAALLRDAAIYEALLLATDAGCLRGERPAVGAGAEGAAALQHLLLAEAATAALCGADLGSGELAAGADTAAALLADAVPSGRRAVLQALALRAAQAVPRLLLMLRLHCALLRSAAGTGAAALGKAAGGGEAAAVAAFSAAAYEPDFELQLAAAPACAHAGHLLAALLTATHADALACWQPHAAAVARAAAAEAALLAALPEAAAGVVGGLGPTRSLLAGLRGGVAAAACLHRGGLPAVMAHLARELPALEARRGPPGAPCSVAWPAVEALFCEPEQLAWCEQGLRLLAARLWAPGSEGRAAAAVVDGAAGLSVLLRAVLTGTELVAASAADAALQGLAGLAIDVGEAAACRRRALSFLEAAAAAMSCLMQHLRGSICTVRGRSLLTGLLRAHSVLCCQEESVACMMGGASGEGGAAAGGTSAAAVAGLQGVLVARHHLASCLRCYVEAAEPWQPPLMQQLFWGVPAPGLEAGQVAYQTPAEMFAAACLLGDLFPPEWPLPGRKAMQAPPTDRRYRATLATAIEPVAEPFRRLVSAGLASESRLLRAAVVRLMARAAGLGGGMGPFLAGPLLEELATVAESPAPLHDARRLLEVIVPLAYRPAVKSAMLAAPFASTLAQLLGVLVGRLSSADQTSEAVAVLTMAMEVAVVLFNHEVCLNPLAPVEQQQLEDMPPLAEAEPMARALLDLLPRMQANAMIAQRVLRLMVAADTGRLALRRAVVALHAVAVDAEPPHGPPNTIAVATAAQWMANKYWALAEALASSSAGAGQEGLRAAYADVVAIMQQICLPTTDEDSLPKVPPPAQRFATALQASVAAAAAAGLDVGGDEHRWEAPGAAELAAADQVYDAVSRMFWRNVRARAAAQSHASTQHMVQRCPRHECPVDPDVTLANSLHPPLTLPRVPPDEPPLVEAPTEAQQQALVSPKVNTATVQRQQQQQQQQRQQRQRQHPAASPTASPTTARPAVKEEATAAGGDAGLPSSLQAADLYADLLQPQGRAASGRQQPSPAVAAPPPRPHQPQPPPPAAARQPQAAPPAGGGPASEPASLQELLSNPAALQALLKDPVQLQRLLEKHPALISVLKSTLGRP